MDATAGMAKHSISIPAVISREVRERAGERGFSAYIAEALEQALRRDALAGVLADMEREHGPVDEAEVEQILSTMAP